MQRARRSDQERPWAEVPWWHSLAVIGGLVALLVMIVATRGGGGEAPGPAAADSVGGRGLTAVSATVPPGETGVTGQTLASAPSATPAQPTATVAPTPTAAPTQLPLEVGDQIKGTVRDADGKAIAGAVVRGGSVVVETGSNGSFALRHREGVDSLVVSASGYADRRISAERRLTVALERFEVKAIYLNGTAAGDAGLVDAMVRLIDETDLNAIVIDIKDGLVFIDSDVELFKDAGMVRPTYDATELLTLFHEHDIYVIGRQVIFKDPLVAEANPKMAILDEESGEIWRGWAGEAWVNPFAKGLYQPNVDLAVEAARLGFDEVQYDYIRFPDGDLGGADLGSAYASMDKRIAAVTTILSMTRAALRPLGVKLSADIFGWMLLVDDDQGIGQRLGDIVAVVDYVSPMIYPSHFPKGSLAVDGHPNDFPYESVDISMSLGMARTPGDELKYRPWLQDFSLPNLGKYGEREIRAQIDATRDVGASGWMMWNVNANYVRAAYEV